MPSDHVTDKDTRMHTGDIAKTTMAYVNLRLEMASRPLAPTAKMNQVKSTAATTREGSQICYYAKNEPH